MYEPLPRNEGPRNWENHIKSNIICKMSSASCVTFFYSSSVSFEQGKAGENRMRARCNKKGRNCMQFPSQRTFAVSVAGATPFKGRKRRLNLHKMKLIFRRWSQLYLSCIFRTKRWGRPNFFLIRSIGKRIPG